MTGETKERRAAATTYSELLEFQLYSVWAAVKLYIIQLKIHLYVIFVLRHGKNCIEYNFNSLTS